MHQVFPNFLCTDYALAHWGARKERHLRTVQYSASRCCQCIPVHHAAGGGIRLTTMQPISSKQEQLHYVLVQLKKLTWSSNASLTDKSSSRSSAVHTGFDLAFCIWAGKAEGGWARFARLVESYVWLSGLLPTPGKPISIGPLYYYKLTLAYLLVCSGTVSGINGSIWFFSSLMCTLDLSQSLNHLARHTLLSIFTLTAWLYEYQLISIRSMGFACIKMWW